MRRIDETRRDETRRDGEQRLTLSRDTAGKAERVSTAWPAPAPPEMPATSGVGPAIPRHTRPRPPGPPIACANPASYADTHRRRDTPAGCAGRSAARPPRGTGPGL